VKKLLILFALTSPVHAQEIAAGGEQTIRVKQGDTLDILAAEYYGDRKNKIFILAENHLQHERPLKAGEKLKIPVSREVVTASGDTFESLAAQYLGDAKRGTFLAEFNNDMPPDETLAVGTTLSIPFHVPHVAAETETLAQISAAYYGDTKYASLIKRYNFLDKDAIEKGDQVVVPIFNVKVKPSRQAPQDANAKQREDLRKKSQQLAINALPAAKRALRDGDFAEVERQLDDFIANNDHIDYLDNATAIDVALAIGCTHVAHDNVPLATAAFKKVLDRKHVLLDRFRYSPRILDVWRSAGGKVDGE
jgi:LysM repeat protein